MAEMAEVMAHPLPAGGFPGVPPRRPLPCHQSRLLEEISANSLEWTVEISATGTQYGSRQVDGKIRHKRKEEAMVGRRIDFDLDDRYAELLEQLIVVKNRLAEHDRGESDEEDYALTEAVAQALIAEETMRQFIDDLLDEALDKGQRLRQIASTVGA